MRRTSPALELLRALAREKLARVLGVKQAAAAKLEKRADMYAGNLRRCIEAMGGTLEITAKLPCATVAITGFSGIGEADAGEQVS